MLFGLAQKLRRDLMPLSRRTLLKSLGTAAGSVAATSVLGSPLWLVRRIEAASLATDLVARAPCRDEFNELADVSFDQARALGCSYADIEIHRFRLWSGLPGDTMNDFPAVIESESSFLDVRVLHSGAWGQIASQRFAIESLTFKKVEAARLTARAVVAAQDNAAVTERPVVFPMPDWKDCWSTPRQNDHCAALIRDQLARVHEETAVKGTRKVNSRVMLRSEEKFFASSKGSCTRTASISVT
jgi:hypothetical protein